ncbi:hypothetical protein BVI2075_310026 [Burkholderia vietnamiensis]|nr:hypothetical protein BVI2075_310026 [Burkholderia vietnamiensis]
MNDKPLGRGVNGVHVSAAESRVYPD